MSDEFGRAHFKDSLVDDSATFDFATTNYPPEGDTTSSGGWGGPPEDVWGNKAQRSGVDTGKTDAKKSDRKTGLVDQSMNDSNLKGQIRDAKQGADRST
ncbi:uncharacterized protein EV420DRAFT_1634851 [Desarmillaria tabescens]|uniref:Uncharacterized protein n=1 Tax=Armillaria tabescens TaxID=1929756 RepID=A0AA39U9C9_ARMTA|nr:uncharacterized protein EV420DRAFT_1634851 [Desarmillaria tabescens]KAK0470430.1 hypothetical protein EV420DRAFT_1634851 [Desarmillaria tabescens]